MKTLALLFTSLTALLVACAPAKLTPVPQGTEPVSERADLTNDVPLTKADHVSSTLFCKGVCPSGLAMFIERLDDATVAHYNRCTAFLVAQDIVATNSHCLSTDLRANGAAPQGRISIVFGATRARARDGQDLATERVNVVQVISATEVDPANLHPDLAFLKLEHEVNRDAFKLSRMGVADKVRLTALVIDPAGDEMHLNGVVREIPCKAVQNSIIVPQFTSDFSDVTVARCDLSRGHSGSPVLGDDGTVRAVVQSILPGDRAAKSFKGYKSPEKFSAAVVMTNMSCAQTPFDLRPVASVCSAPVPSQADLLKTLSASRSFDYDGVFAKWKAPVPFGFEKYEPKSTGAYARSLMPRVTCVKDARTWLRKSAGDLGVDALDHSKHDIIVTMTLPFWGLVPVLDQDERLTPTLGERDRIHMILQFDLETFVKSGNARITQTMTTDNGVVSEQPTTYDLPVCH